MPTPPKKDKKNRYEFEPVPGRTEAPPDVRPDLPGMDSEKGASSPVESTYAGSVSKYFNERRKVADVTDAEDTELFDHDRFLASEQRTLEKLGNAETASEMRPTDAAMAIGDLAGEMAKSSPDVPANAGGDPAADADMERRHGDAKRLFMESAKKLYPNVTVDGARFGEDLKRTADRLGKFADAEFIPSMRPEDIDALRGGDPKALLAKVDRILFQTGDLMQTRARMSFDVNDPRKQEQLNGQIAAASEMYYKLQLMRDELQAEAFGRADTTQKEEDEIERLRASLLGPKKGEKKGEGPSEASPEKLTETERRTLERIEGIASAEDRAAAEAEKHGRPFAMHDRPTVDAFRAVWKEDGDLARRMRSLEISLEETSEARAERMNPPNDELAYELSAKDLFRRLAPAERKALEAAALKEEGRRKGRLTAEDEERRKELAEELFVEFMREMVADDER